MSLQTKKGIENIMLSCGSGSVASAFYAFNKQIIKSPLTIINKGGSMTLVFNSDWTDVWLTSNPVIEFDTSVDLDSMNAS